MDKVECVFIVPADVGGLSYRRYVNDSYCTSPWKFHNAETFVMIAGMGKASKGFSREAFPHEKTRPDWPKHCLCGYKFQDADVWQVNLDRHYRHMVDPRDPFSLKDAPPGAMWDAKWYGKSSVGADGVHLVVKLPTGEHWNIDGASTEGPKWHRTGLPPKITVVPSIRTPRYHGHLRNGVLIAVP